jgi:hypothetical protein
MRAEFPGWIPANYFPVLLFFYLIFKAFLPWRYTVHTSTAAEDSL